MTSQDLSSWMWGDALSLLEQADKLHRRYQFGGPAGGRCWEPPADVFETDDAITIHIALPGVTSDAMVVIFEPGGVTVSGIRRLPAPNAARIHRLEIPYGRFERRIGLPLHALEPAKPELTDGCLVLTLKKVKDTP